MRTTVGDVVIGTLGFALLVVLFIPMLLLACIQFVRDKRTGVWK